ncbi:MAG: hypothetical protein A4E55_02317 [Pelotomaculum sp. PtaU1.Bin035]|nr:MAG: hypothetical protein A4E55_02317 [Pelotomaculum sp. PtaU1.Bin035]
MSQATFLEEMVNIQDCWDNFDMLEAKSICIVDQCITDIKGALANFFENQKRLLPELARDVLLKGYNSEEVLKAIFNYADVCRLHDEIKLIVNRACEELGLYISYEDMPAEISPQSIKFTDDHNLINYAGYCKTTICMSVATNLVTDLCCDFWSSVGVSIIPGYNLINWVINVLNIKNIYLSANADFHEYVLAVKKRLNRVIDCLCSKLEQDLTPKVANLLYNAMEEDGLSIALPA